MLNQAVGKVIHITEWGRDAQDIQVQMNLEDTRRALNYLALTGPVQVGDQVLLNTTAQERRLGTGGFDFVIANLSHPAEGARLKPESGELNEVEAMLYELARGQYQGTRTLPGHIIKGRYTPFQQAVGTLEEMKHYTDVWERTLEKFPVVVAQLHSQIAPVAAGLALRGKTRVIYIMTDAAALPIAFSHLVRDLKRAELLHPVHATITCGQAFGGDYETVTLHSALLAAKHILKADAAIVCQGPGNAGTGTKYGFSGIDQAQNLDIVSALDGTAIAVVRMSSADKRERHRGISYHTQTILNLTYSRCIVPLPVGVDSSSLPSRHDKRAIEGAQSVLDLLEERDIHVTTMGRSPAEDTAFFLAAAAAGLAV